MINITLLESTSIKEAMEALDKTAEKCLLVVDENKKLLGTLTDGDIRRSVLSQKDINERISNSYNSNPTFVVKGEYNESDVKQKLRDLKLDLIPVVNKDNIVVDYLTWLNINKSKNNNKSLQGVKVIIMAGGKGERLKPFTNILPKPLVPIFDKPIIEHIISRFEAVGCSDFYLTVNYKGNIIKAYFEDISPKYKINFVNEIEPLGTAGSLHLLDKELSEAFFVTNCDVIIKADYSDIYNFHKEGSYDVTLVASNKEHILPYGTCELNRAGDLSHINEKPKYDLLVNTGLYILNPEILSLIPQNKFYHITHLIEDAKNLDKKVGVYQVDSDSWIDIGEWAEYKKAVNLL